MRLKVVEQQIAEDTFRSNVDTGRDNRYFRVSSASMCRRKIGYSILGYQPLPVDSHSQQIFDVGQVLHDWCQTKLVAMGWVKAEPFLTPSGLVDWKQTDDPLSGCELDVIDHDMRIIGHLDAITVPLLKEGDSLTPSTDPKAERYLVEVKSITDKSRFWVLGIRDGGTKMISEEDYPSEFIEIDIELSASSGTWQQRLSRFQHNRKVSSPKFGPKPKTCPVYKLKVDGKDELVTVVMVGNSIGSFSGLKEPKLAHISQASLYAQHYGINKILFIYIGKDASSKDYEDGNSLFNVPIKVFEHQVNPIDVLLLQNKIAEIYSHTDKGELPPREYSIDDDKSECRYCQYRHICWPGKVDVEGVNIQLSTLNLPSLSLEAGVMHEHKTDLKEEYNV